MTTDDLTAAVARLREYWVAQNNPVARGDLHIVLSALETAQADARRGRDLHKAVSDHWYCCYCDKGPARPVREAVRAIDAAMGAIAMIRRAMYDAWTQEQTSGKGVIGSMPGHTEGQKMPGPLDHQSAAGTNCAAECAVRAPESFARGPAADPIADLCMQIRAFLADAPKEMPHEGYRYGELLSFAADALERLARERDVLSDTLADTRLRAERAEAERDTLRKCLKSVVSAWDDDYKPTWYERWQPAIDAARAKVNTTEGEK